MKSWSRVISMFVSAILVFVSAVLLRGFEIGDNMLINYIMIVGSIGGIIIGCIAFAYQIIAMEREKNG